MSEFNFFIVRNYSIPFDREIRIMSFSRIISIIQFVFEYDVWRLKTGYFGLKLPPSALNLPSTASIASSYVGSSAFPFAASDRVVVGGFAPALGCGKSSIGYVPITMGTLFFGLPLQQPVEVSICMGTIYKKDQNATRAKMTEKK